MSHAHAALTPRARLRLAQLIVDEGWPVSAASTMCMVSARTADKWADRYRTEGRPTWRPRFTTHRRPTRTPLPVVDQIGGLRRRQWLGIPTSTVHALLVRCRVDRLTRVDRVSGKPLCRYERPRRVSLRPLSPPV